MLTKNKKYGIMVKYSADGTGEGKVVTKGLEANKGDRCLVLKTLTAHIVDMIVGFRHRLIHSFLAIALARVAAMQSQPRQFSIIKKLGRAVGSYEGWEEHVLVARRMLARGARVVRLARRVRRDDEGTRRRRPLRDADAGRAQVRGHDRGRPLAQGQGCRPGLRRRVRREERARGRRPLLPQPAHEGAALQARRSARDQGSRPPAAATCPRAAAPR